MNSDFEGVLSLLNSKDGYISRLIGVMYGFIGFVYVCRLANVAAFILALIALLSFLVFPLLNTCSMIGVSAIYKIGLTKKKDSIST